MKILPPSQEMSLGHQTSSRSSQVAVIRREFVDLTGDHFSAVVLNQLLYWTQRVKDFDLLLEEERTFNSDCNVSPRHGWIYKTAHDLIEETMLGISHPTMRKYIKLLVDQGYVDERPNPIDKWNKTTQYRVNLRKLQEDLKTHGYSLPEVYLNSLHFLPREGREQNSSPALDLKEHSPDINNFPSDEEASSSSFPKASQSKEISNVKNLHRDVKDLHSEERNFHPDVENLHSNVKNLHSYTYTENTSENTNREHTQRTRAREELHEFFEVWERHVGQEGLQLTENRTRQLRSILTLYFDGEIQRWEKFCERIKASPFLMGQGPRKWHVTLDWILEEANVIKVLEGNFDDPAFVEQKHEKTSQSNKEQERSELLASIEDPSWKYWCTQLSRSDLKDPLSLFELKEIAPAKFAEFDGKLVWIEAEDTKILDRVETLRLKLLSVVQHTFPKARNIRTQLKNTLTKPQSFEMAQTISCSSAT